MERILKRLDLNHTDYYETHLAIINAILPEKLTPMEIKVLANFMALEGDIANYRFGPSGRKMVMKNLDLKPQGLSNYIRTMTDKKFLREVGDVIQIWPLLIPEKTTQEYQFKLNNLKYANQSNT